MNKTKPEVTQKGYSVPQDDMTKIKTKIKDGKSSQLDRIEAKLDYLIALQEGGATIA